MRILLTGFGPFGRVKNNPTARIVEQISLSDDWDGGLTTRILPVSFTEVASALPELIQRGNFDLMLMLGVAESVDVARLETRGLNRIYARIPDIDGEMPVGSTIVEGGPEEYTTNVDVERLRQRLREAGFECGISIDAGGYVCNHAYYTALDTIHTKKLGTRCLFLHVPPDPRTFGDELEPSIEYSKALVSAILRFLTGLSGTAH